MKKGKLIISLAVAGIILIITGIALIIYNTISSESKAKKENREIIITNHDIFKTKVEDFDKLRTRYFDEVVSDLYLETVEDYDKWIEVIDEYTKTVDEVENSSSELKRVCVKMFYSSMDVKYKCDSFVIAYETTINYYTKDIIAFNKAIEGFNETLENKLDLYDLKYEYVDVNDDGKYYGID